MIIFVIGSLFREYTVRIIANESYLTPEHLYSSADVFPVVLAVLLFYFVSLIFTYTLIASENQSKRYRHEKIAEHYGLLNIDLQKKLNAYLKQNNFEWNKLFKDNVHPNQEGHKFYAQAIAEELKPFVEKANGHISMDKKLPKQLSSKRLILDGRMVPIPPEGRGLQGSDGRMVAIRAGSRGLQGSDGRMVEIKAGYRGVQGSDGRMVAIAPGKRAVQDANGRMQNK